LEVRFKKLHPEAVIPTYGTSFSAGFDLYAIDNTIIYPGGKAIIGTGFAVALPVGTEMQIRPRSGIALKTNLDLPNSPGTIDADYRNEVGVILKNTNPYSPYEVDFAFNIKGEKILLGANNEVPIGTYIIQKGERIAQGVLAKFEKAEFTVVEELDETGRKGGYGSTGTI
jgi:dUTP pyrophosphatase